MTLAEFVAVLSQATDLAMGQPREYALPSCLLALRLGEALGLDAAARRQVYFHSLLRYLGCNAESTLLSSVAGDEMVFRRGYMQVDTGNPGEVVMAFMRSLRKAHADAGAWRLTRMAAKTLLAMPQVRGSLGAHCEVAQRLGARLGFGPEMIEALGQLYERWDGKGEPRHLRGEAIALSTRIVTLSQDAMVFHQLGGPEAAVSVVRKRKGGAYDPRLADLFCEKAKALLDGIGAGAAWDAVLAAEPGRRGALSPDELDNALAVMADFADLKSLFTLGHSPALGSLAASAAERMGLPQGETRMLRRAGWAARLGRTAISSGIWDKPGKLSAEDWDRIRLHPYHGERLLCRAPGLADLGRLIGTQAERTDGSGYHRGLSASALTPAARLLAAADAYQALLEARPHREAFAPERAAEILLAEAKAGRFDSACASAVLAAAGHAAPARRELPAGLSDREAQVLALMARGLTMKAIGEKLFISAKTVDRHIQNIYGKIGVSTRAAAALFAAENRLLR